MLASINGHELRGGRHFTLQRIESLISSDLRSVSLQVKLVQRFSVLLRLCVVWVLLSFGVHWSVYSRINNAFIFQDWVYFNLSSITEMHAWIIWISLASVLVSAFAGFCTVSSFKMYPLLSLFLLVVTSVPLFVSCTGYPQAILLNSDARCPDTGPPFFFPFYLRGSFLFFFIRIPAICLCFF